MLRPNKKCYGKLNTSSITDNKLYWKTVRLSFSDTRGSESSKITVLEKGKILTDEKKVLLKYLFNTFFNYIINILNIEKNLMYYNMLP